MGRKWHSELLSLIKIAARDIEERERNSGRNRGMGERQREKRKIHQTKAHRFNIETRGTVNYYLIYQSFLLISIIFRYA